MSGKVVNLDQRFPEQPKDQIVSYDTTNLWSPYGPDGFRYNPDDLVGRRGLQIYSLMLNDEQIKAVVDFRLASLLARGWDFKFDESSTLSEAEQQARTIACKQIVRRMRGSFTEVIENVATGREMGFSMTEKVYSTVSVDGRELVGINQLLLRNPASFEFFADEYGTLTQVRQRSPGRKLIDLDYSRFIHYVHRQKWDQFYGRSELRSAYRWWYIKDQVTKFWPMFLEKFGAGFVAAKRVDENAPAYGTPEYNSLREALSNIRALTYIILPRGIELDIKYPGTTDMYEKCIQFCDLAIAKSQLVPNLMGVSHTGQTGAYSQSQTQFEGFQSVVNMDAKRIEECFNEQLFRDLGDQNWGDGEYPLFEFNPASLDHLRWMFSTWKELLGANAVVQTEEDERFLRSLLGMPDRDESDTPVAKTTNALAQEHQQALADISQPTAADQSKQELKALRDDITELKQLMTARGTVAVTVQAPASGTLPSRGHDRHSVPPIDAGVLAIPHENLRGVPRESFDRAVERVAFSVIERHTDSIAIQSVGDLAAIVARSVQRALGTNDNLQTLTDDQPEDVAAFDLHQADEAKLQKACRDLLNSAWALGSNFASNELDRAQQKVTPVQMRREQFTALRDNAAAYFESQSFRMAADASDHAKRIIQQELQNAIKFGTALNDVRAAIWDRLVGKGLTTRDAVRGIETDEAVNAVLDELWVDTTTDAAAYLNTLVRTNTFEALNEARFAEFSDPELADFVLALRYAAVLDSSTTAICSALDDSVFRTDSSAWDTWRPPNHYNCRSILVPITVVDGWDGVESPEPTIEPQEGFK